VHGAGGWREVDDDKCGTASQTGDTVVGSDTAPNYGAIPRLCQGAADL